MKETVHIVSFNVPYPPDYGGVMDVYYKIAALRNLGVEVILHCFTYGRPRSSTLEEMCSKVYYYHRNLNLFFLFRRDPFIVLSRRDQALLRNLCRDEYPIIFEGLHCTTFLNDKELQGRFRMVRTHNIEHMYYRQLARVEGNIFKRIFFISEAKKLERYEQVLQGASLLLSISPGDDTYFRTSYGHTLFVGPFHPFSECHSMTGNGDYILIHGDFSTPENNASAMFMLRNVFPFWKYRTIIAGKRPSAEVIAAATRLKNVTVVKNPSDRKMSDLITNAHICLLHSFQPTGMKLKLITSLCSGRHIISSPEVTAETGMESLCHTAIEPQEWLSLADELMNKSFTDEERESRTPLLRKLADNKINAEKILEQLRGNGKKGFSA